MGTTWSKQLEQLIQEGNDEQIVRLIDALLDPDSDQIEERARLLMALGRRYLVLAISREEAIVGHDLAEALVHMEKGTLTFSEDVVRDSLALSWYECAIDTLTAAINLAPVCDDLLCDDLRTATLHRTLASVLCADGSPSGPSTS